MTLAGSLAELEVEGARQHRPRRGRGKSLVRWVLREADGAVSRGPPGVLGGGHPDTPPRSGQPVQCPGPPADRRRRAASRPVTRPLVRAARRTCALAAGPRASAARFTAALVCDAARPAHRAARSAGVGPPPSCGPGNAPGRSRRPALRPDGSGSVGSGAPGATRTSVATRTRPMAPSSRMAIPATLGRRTGTRGASAIPAATTTASARWAGRPTSLTMPRGPLAVRLMAARMAAAPSRTAALVTWRDRSTSATATASSVTWITQKCSRPRGDGLPRPPLTLLPAPPLFPAPPSSPPEPPAPAITGVSRSSCPTASSPCRRSPPGRPSPPLRAPS